MGRSPQAPTAPKPLLVDYRPAHWSGLSRVRGCLVGAYSVDEDDRFTVLERGSSRKITSRDILFGPKRAGFAEYLAKVRRGGNKGDLHLGLTSFYSRRQIQGSYIGLGHTPGGECFREVLATVLVCKSAAGDIVGHLHTIVTLRHEDDGRRVGMALTLDSIHVLRHWRGRGHANDMIVAAALIGRDIFEHAIQTTQPNTMIDPSFSTEAVTDGGYACAKHLAWYIEGQVVLPAISEGLGDGRVMQPFDTEY